MSQRRNLNVFDVLGLIDDGNDSNVGDLLSEDDSEVMMIIHPMMRLIMMMNLNGMTMMTFHFNNCKQLQQTHSHQKGEEGTRITILGRKRHMNLLILHSKEIHLIIQRKSARHINIFSNLLTAK